MDAICVGEIRGRTEQQLIDDAEHRRIRADSQPERDDDCRGKAWLEANAACCVTKVLRQCVPPLSARLCPIDRGYPPAVAVDAAEATLGFTACVVGRHTRRHEVP